MTRPIRRAPLLVPLLMLLAACAASTPTSAPPTPTPGASATPGVSAVTPAGWQVQRFNDQAGAWLRTAPAGVDLLASVATGPRLVVSPVAGDRPDIQSLILQLGVTTLSAPASASAVTVAGRTAVAVDWTETSLGNVQSYREILVDMGGGHAYRILLESPGADWATALPTLQQIADTITFE